MQQKLLSDQPLRHEPKPKGNGIKMMAYVRWVLCFYAVVFWRLLCGGMPQYLCDAVFMRSGFQKKQPGVATLLPVGFAIDRPQEDGINKSML